MTILRDLSNPPGKYRIGRNRAVSPTARHDAAYAKQLMERERFGRLLLADWKDVVFLHFEADPKLLQQVVPFELDLYEGMAFVSLVAFRMEGMRFYRGGSATRWLTAPIATHHFLNLRTYVRYRGEVGIYFMREWLDNRLAVAMGPTTFGLPYRYARIDYSNEFPTVEGKVEGSSGGIRYSGKVTEPRCCTHENSVDEFVCERYTAYTAEGRTKKRFRVWHNPWELAELTDVRIERLSLIGAEGKWVKEARFHSGHYSRGVKNVWMGPPISVLRKERRAK